MKNKITSVKRISAKRKVLEVIPDAVSLEKRIEILLDSEALTQAPKKAHTIVSLVREKGQIREGLKSLAADVLELRSKLQRIVVGSIVLTLWSCGTEAPRACPSGFVQAPGFCVMQYEARALGAGGELGGSGLTIYETTQVQLDRSLYVPTSTPDGYPWVKITRDDARAECQSLGARYDLISNAQWQTIARDVSEQDANWSGGQVDQGCLYQGVTGDPNECGYSGHPFEAGVPHAGESWIDWGRNRDPRAKLVMSTGAEVWDMSGNVWEWVRENDPMIGRWGPNRYMGAPGYSAELRDLAGPARDFNCSSANYWCGFGFGRIDYTGPTIMRGGMTTFDNDEPWSVGIFAADNDDPLTSANGALGFRCVFQ